MKNRIGIIISFLMIICVMASGCAKSNPQTTTTTKALVTQTESFSIDDIPEFNGEPYVVINDNIPSFTKSDYTTTSYETYGKLDYLGRCTSCIACVGTDLMPTEDRGSIGSVKPTGWQTVKYENVDGKYLYNRCHLIGYQLTAENANHQNLITGTRYLNIEGMLPFENEVADYVKETDNHVLYRVTPIFEGTELVARGVQMEGYSVEDNGKGVEFNVYCYNNQPDIVINYKTGMSKSVYKEHEFDDKGEKKTFIVNLNSKKFHTEDCKFAKDIKDENKKVYKGTKQSLINNGYEPCKSCNK